MTAKHPSKHTRYPADDLFGWGFGTLWRLRYDAEAEVLAALLADMSLWPASVKLGVGRASFDWMPHRIVWSVLEARREAQREDVLRWTWGAMRLAGYDPEFTLNDLCDTWLEPRRDYPVGTLANLTRQAARLRELIAACRDADKFYHKAQLTIDNAIGVAVDHDSKTRCAGGITSRAVYTQTVTADIAQNSGHKTQHASGPSALTGAGQKTGRVASAATPRAMVG